LQTLDPFVRQEAETINQSKGVKCMGDYNGCYVTSIGSGDYIKVRNVDFGEAGAKAFTAKVLVEKKCTLAVRTGSSTSTIKGRLPLEPTNGEWKEVSCDLTTPITGVQNLFFTFTGSGASLFDFDSWQFSGEATGMSDALHLNHQEERIKDNKVYDLTGRRATNSKKIRIEKGKKYITNK